MGTISQGLDMRKLGKYYGLVSANLSFLEANEEYLSGELLPNEHVKIAMCQLLSMVVEL